MSYSIKIYPPPVPPSFFNIAASKISSLATYHGRFAIVGLGCTAKALIEIKSANSANPDPQVNTYLCHAVAGFVSTTALTCLGFFGGNVAWSALGCSGIAYTGYSVYRIGQVNPSLRGLVSRAYFGMALTASIPLFGAGFGVFTVIGRVLRPDEVTICSPL